MVRRGPSVQSYLGNLFLAWFLLLPFPYLAGADDSETEAAAVEEAQSVDPVDCHESVFAFLRTWRKLILKEDMGEIQRLSIEEECIGPLSREEVNVEVEIRDIVELSLDAEEEQHGYLWQGLGRFFNGCGSPCDDLATAIGRSLADAGLVVWEPRNVHNGRVAQLQAAVSKAGKKRRTPGWVAPALARVPFPAAILLVGVLLGIAARSMVGREAREAPKRETDLQNGVTLPAFNERLDQLVRRIEGLTQKIEAAGSESKKSQSLLAKVLQAVSDISTDSIVPGLSDPIVETAQPRSVAGPPDVESRDSTALSEALSDFKREVAALSKGALGQCGGVEGLAREEVLRIERDILSRQWNRFRVANPAFIQAVKRLQNDLTIQNLVRDIGTLLAVEDRDRVLPRKEEEVLYPVLSLLALVHSLRGIENLTSKQDLPQEGDVVAAIAKVRDAIGALGSSRIPELVKTACNFYPKEWLSEEFAHLANQFMLEVKKRAPSSDDSNLEESFRAIQSALRAGGIAFVEVIEGETLFDESLHELHSAGADSTYPNHVVLGVVAHGFQTLHGQVVKKPRVIVNRVSQ